MSLNSYKNNRRPPYHNVSVQRWFDTYQLTWKSLAGFVDVWFQSELVLKQTSKENGVGGRHEGALGFDYLCLRVHGISTIRTNDSENHMYSITPMSFPIYPSEIIER